MDDENKPMLTSEQLEEAIPDFDWRKGHSGLKLLKKQSSVLEKCFENYLAENPDFVQKMKDDKARFFNKEIIGSIPGGDFWEEVTDWLEDEKERYEEKAIEDCANLSYSVDYGYDELMLAVRFKGGKVLHMLCRGLGYVYTNFDLLDGPFINFMYCEDSTFPYEIECNGVDISCKEVIFEQVSK